MVPTSAASCTTCALLCRLHVLMGTCRTLICRGVHVAGGW
jgi:hypothetical protein